MEFISNLDTAAFMKTLHVNVLGTMLCMKAVTKVMQKQVPLVYPGTGRHPSRSLGRGSIVNLGSVSSKIAYQRMMPYATSKHAVIALTEGAGNY